MTRFRRWARRAAILLVTLVVVLVAWIAWNLHDRNRGADFRLDLRPTASATPALRVGFARRTIDPDLTKTVWLAGFDHGRAATAIHDHIYAVAAVIDDGEHRVGLVALDAIGFFHDEVLAVRRAAGAAARLDYVIVASTHNHSTPDVMGIWGPSDYRTGIDPAYRQQIVDASAAALRDAVTALAPATVSLVEIPLDPAGLVADSRDPQVFDATLRLMHFASPGGATIGTIVNWADHPETPWAHNTEVTADFPGYLREALANGVTGPGRQVPGLGGIHLYVNGAIGGLMTTNPDTSVVDPFNAQTYKVPSHEKARAVGRRLADAILTTLRASAIQPEAQPRLAVSAHTLTLAIDNQLFRLANALGLFGRGQPRLNHIRSEVAMLTFGGASIACVPGELYPEIANGGITRPPGADLAIDPVEVPSIRELMPGRVKFLIGLANDEVGYIIPRSEWDDQAPWLYGAPKRHYGEINSLGPDTAPAIHAALGQLSRALATH
jgi:hypothetical protein